MQITITLRIAIHKQIDIQVSSKQKIIDILQILLENHVIQKEQIQNITMIKSLRNSSYVSSLLTLEQAKIYNGDTLVIV